MIEVYTDGSTNDISKCSSIGIYIKNGNEYEEYGETIPYCNNHEAEFIAAKKAIDICARKYPNEILSIRTDSQIVVNAIEKNYVKNKVFQHHLEEIGMNLETFPLFFIKWIPTNQNMHADRLAKKACMKK